MTVRGEDRGLALVSIFAEPDPTLLSASHGTLNVCHYQGYNDLHVVDVRSIQSLIAMVPFPTTPDEAAQNKYAESYYIVEKLFLASNIVGRQQEGASEEAQSDSEEEE